MALLMKVQSSTSANPGNYALNAFSWMKQPDTVFTETERLDCAARAELYLNVFAAYMGVPQKVDSIQWRTTDVGSPWVPISGTGPQWQVHRARATGLSTVAVPNTYTPGGFYGGGNPTVVGTSVCVAERLNYPAGSGPKQGRHFLPFVTVNAMASTGTFSPTLVLEIEKAWRALFQGVAQTGWNVAPAASLPMAGSISRRLPAGTYVTNLISDVIGRTMPSVLKSRRV
jgi:hypothetical protein